MTTSIYRTLKEAKQEMLRRLNEDLSDVLRLVLRRHGSGYAVDYQTESLPLPLGPGGKILGPQGTDPVDGEQPSGSGNRGEDEDEGPSNGPGTPPGSPRRKQENTRGGEPTTPAPPEISDDPLEVTVVVHEQDFRRDHTKAQIEGVVPYLARQITIEIHELCEDEWTTLMQAAREKQPVRLKVRLIVSAEHRVNRSRVVATHLIGITQSAQVSLF